MHQNNSSLELNAAIIVSSAPAFASFARSHLFEASAIKSFFSSLRSISGKTGSSISKPASNFKSDRVASGNDEHAKQQHNHHYYELNETYGLRSGVSVEQGGKVGVLPSPGSLGEGGIIRTMAFEQTVKPSAV